MLHGGWRKSVTLSSSSSREFNLLIPLEVCRRYSFERIYKWRILKENVPWTIDAQYVPGFDWLRNAEIRIVKDWDKKVWLGIEASSPSELLVAAFQQYYFGGSGISKAKCEAFFSNPDNFDWTWFKSWKAHPELDLMLR